MCLPRASSLLSYTSPVSCTFAVREAFAEVSGCTVEASEQWTLVASGLSPHVHYLSHECMPQNAYGQILLQAILFLFEHIVSLQLSTVMHMPLVDLSASKLHPDRIVMHQIEVLLPPICCNSKARVC